MHVPVVGVQPGQCPISAVENTGVARMREVSRMDVSRVISGYASAWRAERNMLTAA